MPSLRSLPLVLVPIALAALAGPAAAQLQPTVAPPQRIDPGGGEEAANETTASATPSNPLEIVAGWNDWRLSGGSEVINSGFSVSLDGGVTWSDFLLRPPAPNQSLVEGDPMTAFDDRTGTLFAGAISFSAGSQSGIYVARKDPGSATFEPAVMARTTSGTDKCWMAAGPRPGAPDSTRLYVTYNEGVIFSDDLGQTWTTPNSLGSGIGFLPRVGPAGELYVAYWGFGEDLLLKRSFDGGQTFQTRVVGQRLDVWGTQSSSRVPGTYRIPPITYLAVDPVDGTLYVAWFDTTSIDGDGNFNLDLYLARSDDQGDTWTAPSIVETQAGGDQRGDQFFPWIECDHEGRLHLLWLDGRRDLADDDDPAGLLDAYYAFSVDRGETWIEQRLSDDTPWSTDDDGLDRPNQFLGDYLGMAYAGESVHPVYLDASNGDTDILSNRVRLPTVGDVDGDGLVGFDDLLGVLAAFGPCPAVPCAADVDGDGTIGFDDLLLVLSRWGG